MYLKKAVQAMAVVEEVVTAVEEAVVVPVAHLSLKAILKPRNFLILSF